MSSEMSIKFDMENKPGISNLINIYSSLSGLNYEEIEEKFSGFNYGSFKNEVADLVVDKIKGIQDKYYEYLNSDIIDKILDAGKNKTLEMAENKFLEVKEKVGLGR